MVVCGLRGWLLASMALSIVSKVAITTESSATLSSPSFTPPAGAALVVAYFGFLYNTGVVILSDNFGDSGVSWVPFIGNLTTTTDDYQQPFAGWYRVIGKGAAAGLVTVNASNWGGGNQALCVDQVTSSSGTISVPQTQGTDTVSYSPTGSVALPSAPASSSMVWSAAGCGESGLTPDVTNPGFTQLDLLQTWSSQATAYENTSGPTTVAWSGLSAGQVNALIVCEIAENPLVPVVNTSSALIGFFP